MNKKYIIDKINSACVYRPQKIMHGKLPGTRYQRQFYLANGLYDKQFLEYVTDFFFKEVDEKIGHWDFQIAGREWSAIPLLTGIPLLLKLRYDKDINSFLIKRERKNYGKNNYIEGVPNDKPVLIVDDLCNSTNSFIHCKTVVENTENLETLKFIFAVVNKYPRGSDGFAFDRYLGEEYTPLFVVSRDELNVN